ncbi:MAG: class I adenylate-forming enzyme family protein [Micromonosporaceae bacterium]
MELVTAAENLTLQRRAASGLHRSGVRPGERIAVLLPPSGAMIALVLGALRAGVVPVVLDPSLVPRERTELLTDADPALVVDSAAALAALLDAPPGELAEAPLGRPMHYTSGTTGRRKGVYSGVLEEAAAAELLAEERELWDFDPDDLHLVLSPLHHSAPLRFAAGTLLAGGAVLLAGRFDPAVVLGLTAYRPTTTFCVPTHLARLREAQGAGAPVLRGFRLVAHAGEPCPPAVKRWAVAAFPKDSVYEFYGSTEGQFTVSTPADWAEHPGSVGRARPGRRLRIAADGTIWCAVPEHARFSYWRDPAKTARAWQGEEFTVGDAGRLDPYGYLYLDGRREDLVITGGVNVYPLEVERVLAECPGVHEIAAYGQPDPRWGQRLCAAYAGPASPELLDGYAHEQLSAAKRPKTYTRVAELPRISTGKIRRSALPALAAPPISP